MANKLFMANKNQYFIFKFECKPWNVNYYN